MGEVAAFMGEVAAFRPRRGPWLPSERAVIEDLRRTFEEAGIEAECRHGPISSGEPWTIFYCPSNGHFLALIARPAAGYLIQWADQTCYELTDIAKLAEIVRRGAPIYIGGRMRTESN